MLIYKEIIKILLHRYNYYKYNNYNGEGVLKIMSSLHKFHRRTASFGPPPPWPPTSIGMGDNTHGYWLGTAGDGTSKLIVAPNSTQVTNRAWGSAGTARGTTSTTNGLANTNTLAGFGQAAHPAAYYCKTLTTGGYNTWYLPASSELVTAFSYNSATPFATANALNGAGNLLYSTSTEFNAAQFLQVRSGSATGGYDKSTSDTFIFVRAVRRFV